LFIFVEKLQDIEIEERVLENQIWKKIEYMKHGLKKVERLKDILIRFNLGENYEEKIRSIDEELENI
jgi:hypothetical protein